MEAAMAVFDPNDWWERQSRSRTPDQKRRNTAEINEEVVTRWFTSTALCLCFALLAPVEHLGVTFAALLVIAGIASAALALIRHERFYSSHLTPWDEALWSLAAGLGLWLLSAPKGLG
jgi:Flp pilus assembly protein TadB